MKISGGIFDKNNIKDKLVNLNILTSSKDFYKDKKKVKKIVKEKKLYEDIIHSYKELSLEVQNLKDINSLGAEENNQEIILDCLKKIELTIIKIKNIEAKCFLSGENEQSNIF